LNRRVNPQIGHRNKIVSSGALHATRSPVPDLVDQFAHAGRHSPHIADTPAAAIKRSRRSHLGYLVACGDGKPRAWLSCENVEAS
jgi:hypothetical protein